MIPKKDQIVWVDPDVRKEIEALGVLTKATTLPIEGAITVIDSELQYEPHMGINVYLITLPNNFVIMSGKKHPIIGAWEITEEGYWVITRDKIKRPLFVDNLDPKIISNSAFCLCPGTATNQSLFNVPRWVCDICGKEKPRGWTQ